MSILTLLYEHKSRYPLMQPQDVYKLLYQSALGSAHAIINPQRAHDWLDNEVKSLIAPYPEPVIDPISPDGTLARVHLAPYLAHGGDLEVLLNAFIRTSREYTQDRGKFESYLEKALSCVTGLEDLVKKLKDQGYPAMHHSQIYRQAYKPAYRVVLQQFL